MKTAVSIRHVGFEDLGNFEPVLLSHGYPIEYREAGIDRLQGPDEQVDLLVVLGGPVGAYDEGSYSFLAQELGLLEHRLKRDSPRLPSASERR